MSKTKSLQLKPLLIALAAVAISAFGGFAFRSQSVAYADFPGGVAEPSPATTLYIPNDYTAGGSDTGQVAVKAGIALTALQDLDIIFSYDPNTVTVLQDVVGSTDVLVGKAHTTVTQLGMGKYEVKYTGLSINNIDKDATLFHLAISLNNAKTSVQILMDSLTMTVEDNTTVATPTIITSPTFDPGMITISAAASCPQACGDHGACDTSTKKCVCNTGFSGLICNQCDTGFTGYPNCMLDIYSNLKGVILTLSPDTIGKLTEDERKKAYSSVYVIFKSVPPFSGSIKLGTASYDLGCTSHASNDLEKIRECATAFAENMQNDPDLGPGWKATVVGDMSGVVKLEPQDPSATLDGISSTTGDVQIVPAMRDNLTLDPLASYSTEVIGVLDTTIYNTATPPAIVSTTHVVKDLNFSDVSWVLQPTNRLNQSALNGGLLERDSSGATSGPLTSPVFVELIKADKSIVKSVDTITVEVPNGPVIDYARVIGSGSIVQGARVNLSVKVSDVDTISDIQDIRTSLVKPSDPDPTKNTTYAEIRNDASAVWIDAKAYVEDVQITDKGTTPATPGTNPATPAVAAPPANYRVYSIPVDIPQSVVDGDYKLVLLITDKAGNPSSSVIPFKIGKGATGDVNGDGKIDMLDVILAYQIANGKINGSPSQIEAANLDGMGNITMLDVVLLFNKVNNK